MKFTARHLIYLMLVFQTQMAKAQSSPALTGNFFERLYQAYKQELSETDTGSSPRRIPDAPLDAPPFPNAEWNYGGSSVIGATNTTNYPLMRALYSGPHGDWWKRSRVQIYGWVNPGFNFSTSKHSLLPEGYNFYANRIQL